MLIPQHDQLFRNDGNGVFSDVSKSTGITKLPARVGRGTAFGDYDNDGDVDILIVNNYAEPMLLRNNASANWLHIKLVGTNENRNAIGARIELTTTDSTQIREIYAGESYMSSNSLIAEFGLGELTQAKTIRVLWTNGKSQTLKDISANQLIQITQQR